jgi:serine/threonine protein phosphatase PrpC
MSMSPEMGVIKPKALLPFTVESVGTYSCHGVEPGIRQGETSAKINQDRGCVCFPFGSDSATKTMTLMCVFDGHGAQGDKVSHYVMNEVQKKLEDHPTLESNPEKAMKDVFVDVDNALRKDPTIDAELSGTTAVVCLFVLEATGLVIYTANAGDSRATIGQNRVAGQPMKSHNLSEDQKPDSPQEMKRIQKAGGHVSPPEEEWGGPARVWIDANMTLPGLAMARSIGDHLVKTVGVIPDPEVTKYAVKPGDEFLVMASDGVWEFIDSPEGVNLVAQFIEASATEACTRLIETSAAKWRQEEGDYRDDITAICVRLADVAKDMAQA